MAKKYKGSLTLEWKNKNKSIILQEEGENNRDSDTPLDTKLHWVNEEESLYYELDSEKGKGKKAYWVDRNDIRVKEVRPLLHQATYTAKPQVVSVEKGRDRSLLEDPSNQEIEYKIEETNVPFGSAQGTNPEETNGMLIKGDNLLALNALVKHFENKPEEEKPKCIYIDPPYNTGSAFEHYDDNMEHSEWLTLMRDRLILLRQLLREDGTLWISVDDDESHYMKVLCDEIFGRMNFVANVVWQKKYSPQNDAKWFSDMHDHILIYAKNKEGWRPNLLSRTEEQDKAYNNPDKDPRGPWKSTDSTCNKSNIERPNLYYAMINPHTKKEIWPLESRVWRYAVSVHLEKEKDNRVWWGLDVGQTH